MSLLNEFFGQILKLIYNIVQNYGLSIVIFGILAKVIMLPLLIKQTKSTKIMNEINPRIQEIQKKYKDPKIQGEQLQKLYKEYHYNPMSGCLPLLIQFPIIIALFNVMREPAKYCFTAAEFASISKNFLWIKDLGQPDALYILPILSALTTYFQSKTMMGKQSQTMNNPAMSSMNMMTKIMPIMMLFICWKLPAGLVLYWVISNIFSIVQQVIMLRDKGNVEPVIEVVEDKKERISKKKGAK